MVVLRESLDGMPMLSSIAYPVVQRHYRLAKEGIYFPGKDKILDHGRREPTKVLIHPVEVLGTVAIERYYINRAADLLIEENKRLIDLMNYADNLTKRTEECLGENDEESELKRLRSERLAKLSGRRGFR